MPGKGGRFKIAGQVIKRGAECDVRLKVSETYTGDPVAIPIHIRRATKPGPTVFVSAALHGDEVNGTGIIHKLMYDDFYLTHGTLLLIPVINVYGFENNIRYLPDRRDLNRVFPGSESGNMASRIAYRIMQEIVRKSDFGIDLHSAAVQRTNYPNVRGDFSNPQVLRLATSFGCEIMVNGKGPAGSLRREACRAGCPTFILEAGEPLKMEPAVLDIGVSGVRNVLIELGMIQGEPVRPAVQRKVTRTTWVRARVGGILRFHVVPGERVRKGQPLATNHTILGREQSIITSPASGLVLGMTTMPAVKPGEPVCHIARMNLRQLNAKSTKQSAESRRLHQAAHDDLATSIQVTDPDHDFDPLDD